MYEIKNEQFGEFIAQKRKEKGLTQKQLADKLFVSDKAVSKWERGLSIPNVSLLIPLAEILEVGVAELLTGQSEPPQAEEKTNEKIIDRMNKYSRAWKLAFFVSLAISAALIYILTQTGLGLNEMRRDVLVIPVMMLAFGCWFCFFAKSSLPGYYEENTLNYYSQGPVRIHMPGLKFNNGNWPHICAVIKGWTLASAPFYPLLCLIVRAVSTTAWDRIKNPMILVIFGAMIINLYITGKKYE